MLSIFSTPFPNRLFFFFFNDTATTEIYTLSLHDALPICLLLDEPRSQRSQLFRVTAKHPSLKLVFAFDFNVGHNYSQHLLVDIDSRYPVRHRLLLAGSGERAAITLTRVAGYRRSPGEDNDAQ